MRLQLHKSENKCFPFCKLYWLSKKGKHCVLANTQNTLSTNINAWLISEHTESFSSVCKLRRSLAIIIVNSSWYFHKICIVDCFLIKFQIWVPLSSNNNTMMHWERPGDQNGFHCFFNDLYYYCINISGNRQNYSNRNVLIYFRWRVWAKSNNCCSLLSPEGISPSLISLVIRWWLLNTVYVLCCVK